MANLEAVVLVIHLIATVALIVLIMVQPSEAGGFMGNSGSMSNLMMPRGSANTMTRLTQIMAGLFFATSMVLAIAASHRPVHHGIFEADTGPKATAPAPVKGTSAEPHTAPAAVNKTDAGANTNTTNAPAPADSGKPDKKKKTKPPAPQAPETE